MHSHTSGATPAPFPRNLGRYPTVTRGALTGNGPDVAESDRSSGAYADLEADEAATRRRLDAIAVQAAGEAHADLFITRRPYLHSLTWGLARGIVIATPEQALPLVSLYLRGQGAFSTYRSLDGTATHTASPMIRGASSCGSPPFSQRRTMTAGMTAWSSGS